MCDCFIWNKVDIYYFAIAKMSIIIYKLPTYTSENVQPIGKNEKKISEKKPPVNIQNGIKSIQKSTI